MNPSDKPWYEFAGVESIDSPQLIIYRQRVAENIRLAVEMTGDPNRLRPHVKTHKMRQVALMQQEAGIRKFKCATISEADMLGMNGAPDVLLAYQPVGPKLDRFVALVQRYPLTTFACLVDNQASAEAIGAAGADAGLNIRVFVDLNIGMNRTGIEPGAGAQNLYESCNNLKGIQAVGLHAYAGHIRDKDLSKRTKKLQKTFAPVQELQKSLEEKGYRKPVIVAGGIPDFPIHAENDAIECSPGTFVFWDAGYQQSFPEQKFQPAALILCRAISLPDETSITLDLGHKSVAAENPLEGRVLLLNAPDVTVIGQSEEHLVLKAPKNHGYKIGDVFFALPAHVCPTVALYQWALVVDDGAVADEWEVIARNRKINE